MKTTIIVILVILVVAVGAWYMNKSNNSSQDTAGGSAVAVVNGEEIFQSEFDSAKVQVAAQQGLDPATLAEQEQKQLQEQIVSMLVSQTLLKQAADKAGVNVPEEDIDRQIQRVKDQFENEEAYQQALSNQGVSEDELRDQFQSELAIQNYLSQELDLSSISASDEEIKQVYEQQNAATGGNLPPLEQVREQLKQLVLQQKQQQMISDLVEKLRADAEIEILI